MQTHSPEVEKGVEAGKKLPRKFSSVAESFLANHTRDFAFFNNLIFVLKRLNFLFLLNWTILHLNFFSIIQFPFILLFLKTFVQELVCLKENQFSFFDILKLIFAETIHHNKLISEVFVLLFNSVWYLSYKYFCRNYYHRKRLHQFISSSKNYFCGSSSVLFVI